MTKYIFSIVFLAFVPFRHSNTLVARKARKTLIKIGEGFPVFAEPQLTGLSVSWPVSYTLPSRLRQRHDEAISIAICVSAY